MKNIFKINLLLLTFIFTSGTLISTSSHAMGKKRFDAIVASHKSHMKGLGQNTKKYTYFQLDQLDRKVKRDKNSFLVVSGKNILDPQTSTKIDEYIIDRPQVTVIADYLNSDLNRDAFFNPVGDCTHIKSCFVSNINSDIKFLDILLKEKNAIEYLHFIGFRNTEFAYCDDVFNKFSNRSLSIDLTSLSDSARVDFSHLFFSEVSEISIKPIGKKYSLVFKSKMNPSKPSNLLMGKKRFLLVANFLSNSLLNSKINHNEKLGQSLKDQLVALMPEYNFKLNLEKIKVMTPKRLKDIKKIKDHDVPSGFETIFKKVKSMISDSTLDSNFDDYFLPMLKYYFGVEDSEWLFWKIPEANVDEFKIAIKHLLKTFNKLMSNKKQDVVASYMSVLLEGYTECQTRQVGELNQILAALGVRERQLDGLEGDIWNWINDFKMESFYDYQKDHPSSSSESTHDYFDYWTAINTAVKLPSAIRGYTDDISLLTKREIKEINSDFLLAYFTTTGISEKIYKKLSDKKSSYSPMDVRTLIANMEGTDTMSKFSTHKNGYDAYFKPLAGKAAPKNFTWETSPITKGEVNRLLVLLRVFNK